MYGRRYSQSDRVDAAWLAGFLVGVSSLAAGMMFWSWFFR